MRPSSSLQVDADAARQGNQVDHRVGGAADRGVGADGVFKGFARENLRHAHIVMHQLNDASAGFARHQVAPGVDGGNGGVAWHAHAQRFHHAGHGGSGSHGHAMAVRAVHRRLGFMKLGQGNGARAQLLAHGNGVGARSHGFALVVAAQHGAARYADGGQIDTGGAHHQRGRGLVAAHEQHDAVQRVRACRFLDIHRGQVAIQHGRGAHHGLA